MSKKAGQTSRRFRRARALTCAAVFVLVLVGLLFHTGTGTLSSAGVGAIASVCPLGQLEVFLAGKNANAHMVIVFVAMVLLVVCGGRAFCAWLCPIPPIVRFFRRPRKGSGEQQAKGDVAFVQTESSGKVAGRVQVPAGACAQQSPPPAGAQALAPVGGERDGMRIDSRHVVLGGALLSAGIFGLPVFCLVCPVGLAFATVISVFCMFRFGEVSVGVLLFPAIIALEVLVCRKWCMSFCPLGALMSLIAQANRTLRPRVDSGKCLRGAGVDCRRCVESCPEKVDPHSASIAECTKCAECVTACPAAAIRIELGKGASARAASNKE